MNLESGDGPKFIWKVQSLCGVLSRSLKCLAVDVDCNIVFAGN